MHPGSRLPRGGEFARSESVSRAETPISGRLAAGEWTRSPAGSTRIPPPGRRPGSTVRLHVVVLNWHDPAATAACAGGVAGWGRLAPTVWVVDNSDAAAARGT